MNTGEILLIEQLQQQLSGQHEKIFQIEKKLGTGGIVMQVKSELGNEYKGIVEYATNQVNTSMINFWQILSFAVIAISLIGGIIGYFAKRYIDNIFSKVEEKEKNIKIINDDIINKNEDILDIEKRLIEKENNLFIIQQKIDSQNESIYNHVMQTTTNYWFERLETFPQDWENLKRNIFVSYPKYVQNNKNYGILRNLAITNKEVLGALYQFFAGEIFKDNLLQEWIENIKINSFIQYFLEITKGSQDIFETYNKLENKGDYEVLLKNYLNGINEKIIKKNIRKYSPTQLQELTEFLYNKTLEIGKLQIREEIKNPPAVEIQEFSGAIPTTEIQNQPQS